MRSQTLEVRLSAKWWATGLFGENQSPIRKLELGDVEMAGHSFNRRGEVKPVSRII